MQILVPGFSIVSTLNQGDSATVYLALERPSGRELALKVMPLAHQRMEDKVLAVTRQRLQEFSHPNIVKIFDLGLGDGYVYLTMEYLPGSHLNHKRFELNFLERLRVITDIARGLEYIGAQGYVHGALTPDNIVVHDPDGRGMLVGFNVSQHFYAPLLNTRAGMCSSMTPEVFDSVGTPVAAHFASPEQLQGKALDPRSDLYSLGVILFLLLADYLPFEGATLDELSAQSSRATAPQLPEHLLAFQPIINRLLTSNIQTRYNTATECIAELGSLPESVIHQAVAGFERILLQQGEQGRSPWATPADSTTADKEVVIGEIIAQHDNLSAADLKQVTSPLRSETQSAPEDLFDDVIVNSIHVEHVFDAGNSVAKRQGSRFSQVMVALVITVIAMAAVYYLSAYLHSARVNLPATGDVAEPLVPKVMKHDILRFPVEPGLEEQASVLRKRLDQDFNFATDLVVIYRAGLRGEGSAEQTFARNGLNELQEIFSRRIQTQVAAQQFEEAQKTRAMAQQLFEADELLPVLKGSFLTVTEPLKK